MYDLPLPYCSQQVWAQLNYLLFSAYTAINMVFAYARR